MLMMQSQPTTPAASAAQVALDGALAALRESEIRLLTEIADQIADLGESAEDDRRRLLDVAQDLRDAFFLVVIIGEFNAGKSTFINALLGDDLLPVGITPTTELIEVIRHHETPVRKPEMKGDAVRLWAHPETGAPGVALVDTPGTGSVFQKHERIAKDFLHRSDLVIFVISAKRAFGETERLYLDLARSYGKKVIVVMNQIDLLTSAERAEVRRFVERQIDELLGIRPPIFMVSARAALEARKQGRPLDPQTGADGVDAVRAHLRGVIAAAPPAQQKLLSQLDLAERIVRKYLDVVDKKAALVTADTARVRDVQSELERQSAGLEAQLRGARAEIDNVFIGLRQRGKTYIEENLSPRRLIRPISREVLQTEFQERVIGRALRDISQASSEYVNALVDHSRIYWRGVIDRLNQLRDLMDQEFAGFDASVYAEQREALQDAIRIAEGELKSYSTGQIVDELDTTFRNNMSNFATGGIAAVVGLILSLLAIAAPGPIVGAGAAALALPALIIGAPLALIGGTAAYRYYRRVVKATHEELTERIDRLQQSYHDALDTLTQKERTRLTQYGKQVLTPFFSRLDVLAKKYLAQQTTLRNALEQIDLLRRGIEAV
jgi:small GTP-binding protein